MLIPRSIQFSSVQFNSLRSRFFSSVRRCFFSLFSCLFVLFFSSSSFSFFSRTHSIEAHSCFYLISKPPLMSKILSKFTSINSSSNGRSRLDTKFNKLTNSSQSSSPSLADLHEIAIFSFNSSKLFIINANLTKNFQIIKANSVKSLAKNLVKILKTLVIFQYLVQVGSEEFVNYWKSVNVDHHDNPNFEILTSLLDNLLAIENSNLCQENSYLNSTSSSSTSSSKQNVKQYLSSTINKLTKLANYLRDDEDLNQFRLSFQKLRSDMTKPTPRSSMDHSRFGSVPHSATFAAGTATSTGIAPSRASHSVASSSRPITATTGATTAITNYNYNFLDDGINANNDDFDRIDFELIKPNINHAPSSFFKSRSLDLSRSARDSSLIYNPSASGNSNSNSNRMSSLNGQRTKESQKSDFRSFSNQILLKSYSYSNGNSGKNNTNRANSSTGDSNYQLKQRDVNSQVLLLSLLSEVPMKQYHAHLGTDENNKNGHLTPLIEVNEPVG